MSDDPRTFNQPNRTTLSDADVGGLGQAVLTLTHELWVLIDRVTVLEAILDETGMDVREKIASYQPNAELQKELDTRGRALVARVVEAMAATANNDTREHE